jgi:hypothetical protein
MFVWVFRCALICQGVREIAFYAAFVIYVHNIINFTVYVSGVEHHGLSETYTLPSNAINWDC